MRNNKYFCSYIYIYIYIYIYWLVGWNIWLLFFHINWECHHPNWRSLHHFSWNHQPGHRAPWCHLRIQDHQLVGVWKMFFYIFLSLPQELGWWSNLTNSYFSGGEVNHQLVNVPHVPHVFSFCVNMDPDMIYIYIEYELPLVESAM